MNHRSDIWSGSVAMMNILVGKGAKWGPHSQVLIICVCVAIQLNIMK